LISLRLISDRIIIKKLKNVVPLIGSNSIEYFELQFAVAKFVGRKDNVVYEIDKAPDLEYRPRSRVDAESDCPSKQVKDWIGLYGVG